MTSGTNLPLVFVIEYAKITFSMGKFYDIDPQTCSREELLAAINGCKIKEENYYTLEQSCKRFINSQYGAMASKYYVCNNKDIAESITLQGQDLIKYSVICVNRYFKDDWNKDTEAHRNIANMMREKYPQFDADSFMNFAANMPIDFGLKDTLQIYGDSCDKDTMIAMHDGTSMRVEDLYMVCYNESGEHNLRGKSFVNGGGRNIINYSNGNVIVSPIAHVIKHNVTKSKWSIQAGDSDKVYVTGDHSIIVIRDGIQKEVKPFDILSTDLLICLRGNTISYEHALVENVGYYDNECVYDIEVRTNNDNEHNFFGNNILIHNTDSVTKDSIIRTEKHPDGITIGEWYEENKDDVGASTLAGHTSVNTTDKALNWKDGGLYYGDVKRIIKHETSKKKWKLTTSSGKSVVCTQDHSLVVFRDGKPVHVKPENVLPTDKVLVKKSKSTPE